MRKNTRNVLTAAGFLAPNFLGFLAFTCFPVVFSLVMAFTNWSAKPAVDLEYRGLRNFETLLGFTVAGPEVPPHLMWTYIACAFAALLGAVGLAWAGMSRWRGAPLGGWLAAATGLAAVVATFALGLPHAVALVGILAIAGGVFLGTRGSVFALGKGLVPAFLMLAGVVGLAWLDGDMWRWYEPRDGRFWYYLYNTLYLMLGLPAGIALSLISALLLNNAFSFNGWGRRIAGFALSLVAGAVTFWITASVWGVDAGAVGGLLWLMLGLGFLGDVVAFRTLFYLPQFTAGVALMILWKAMYNPDTGPINAILQPLLHWFDPELDAPKWLVSTVWAKPAIMFMGLWTAAGGTNMLLYLAALSNVPRDLLDAAEVDGAGLWGRFAHVTWPQLAPTTFFIVVMAVIGGLQGGFEQARVMTAGGPAGATTTLSYYIYVKAFSDLELGYAAAISWVLFAIVFVATLMNWRFGRTLEDV